MVPCGEGDGGYPRKFVLAEALMQLGGSLARYNVKLLTSGFLTYVEAYVPAPAAGCAEGPVLVRCAGAVSGELAESEDSGADALLGVLKDRFGALVVDEAELRKTLEEKKRTGSLRHGHSMTFEVALEGRCAGDPAMFGLYHRVNEGVANLEIAGGGKI